MSKPMSPDQLIVQLKKWGVRYKETSGWKTRNRGNRGNGWSDLRGFMWHHTGSDGKDQISLLQKGTGDLPGPLCQFGVAQDGTVYLIGWGRANHAGSGDGDVLKAVTNEDYGSHPPTDNQTNVDGNGHFYGAEIWYSGSHGMTPQQYSSMLRLSAAICDFHKWTAKSCIGHGEWQPGKWDPGYKSGTMMDMSAVRNDVADVLSGADKNADGDTVDQGEKNAPKTPSSTGKTYTLKKGDTIVWPDGRKEVVK